MNNIFYSNIIKNSKEIIFIIVLSITYSLGFIDTFATFISLFYFVCCYKFSFNVKGTLNTVIGFLIFFISILLFLHLIPGFNNFLIIDAVNVSDNGIPYSLYVNFDKLLVAFSLLAYAIPKPLTLVNRNNHHIVLTIFVSYVVAISIALVSGMVEFDLKLTSYFFYWFFINLFITAFAEEAFFRGFVQSSISVKFNNLKYNHLITIGLSGFLFGIAHFPAGITYVSIATILGCSYAYTYLRSGNIYIPIIGHFVFNLIHFVFFTYPFILQV